MMYPASSDTGTVVKTENFAKLRVLSSIDVPDSIKNNYLELETDFTLALTHDRAENDRRLLAWLRNLDNEMSAVVVGDKTKPYYVTVDSDTTKYFSGGQIYLIKQKKKIKITIKKLNDSNFTGTTTIWNLKKKEFVKNKEYCEVSLEKPLELGLSAVENGKTIHKFTINIYEKPLVFFYPEKGDIAQHDGTYGFDNGHEFANLRNKPTDYNSFDVSNDAKQIKYYASNLFLADKQEATVKIDFGNSKLSIGELDDKAKNDKKFKISLYSSTNSVKLNGKSSISLNYQDIQDKTKLNIKIDADAFNNNNFTTPAKITVYDQDSTLIGQLNVYCEIIKELDIAFILVNHKNNRASGYPTNDVASYLNYTNAFSHNQVFRRWNRVYTANGSRIVDSLNIQREYDSIPNQFKDITHAPLIAKIYEKKYNSIVIEQSKIHYFFITNINATERRDTIINNQVAYTTIQMRGAAKEGGFYGNLYLDGGKGETAHELGHLLGLPHTFTDKKPSRCVECNSRRIPKRTTNNFMDYEITRTMHFIYQCKQVANKATKIP